MYVITETLYRHGHAAHVLQPLLLLLLQHLITTCNSLLPTYHFYSDPQNNNQLVIVDDYLDGYRFLREETPEDSRVMAWWDYGYQINGIANRTTIADGTIEQTGERTQARMHARTTKQTDRQTD